MLVLEICLSDTLCLGDNVSISFKALSGRRAKLYVKAPTEIRVTRIKGERRQELKGPYKRPRNSELSLIVTRRIEFEKLQKDFELMAKRALKAEEAARQLRARCLELDGSLVRIADINSLRSETGENGKF